MHTFDILKNIIQQRRSTKPSDMNGKTIDKAVIEQLLSLANWAPTHARTEPWRFVVYEKAAKQQFCADHAELYKTNTDPEKFMQGKYDKLVQQGDPVSHIVLVYMKRTQTNTIPVLEEVAAVSAAIQNILLGAAAQGIAALWGSGGMTHHPSMKKYLGLEEADIVMGILYLGYSDIVAKSGTRSIPIENKVVWHS
ncbi:MAG: nitroreductase [Bacteroidota bacterium]